MRAGASLVQQCVHSSRTVPDTQEPFHQHLLNEFIAFWKAGKEEVRGEIELFLLNCVGGSQNLACQRIIRGTC